MKDWRGRGWGGGGFTTRNQKLVLRNSALKIEKNTSFFNEVEWGR